MQGIGDDSPGEYEIQCYLLLAFHQDNFDEMKDYSIGLLIMNYLVITVLNL